MTDGGAAYQPGEEEADQEELAPSFRPRSAYVGYKAFGSGDGAVLIEPEVARDLRYAAELATQERRIGGGLLYGRPWSDDQGSYLVVDGFLAAGPGENRGDRLPHDGADAFTLSQADLRLLRTDAGRMYSAALEVGWWRTLPGPGAFGPGDFATQAKLAGPEGAGLLVFGSGRRWGTAYLGPGGYAPDVAGTLVASSPADPATALAPRRAQAPDPEPLEPAVVDISAGESLAENSLPELDEPLTPAEVVDLGAGESLLPEPPDEEPFDDQPAADEPRADEPLPATGSGTGTALATRPVMTPAPQPSGPRVISPIPVPAKEWGVKPPNPSYVGPEIPTDVKVVVGALIVVPVIAATIIGILLSSVIIAVIIAVVFVLAVLVTVWMSRL